MCLLCSHREPGPADEPAWPGRHRCSHRSRPGRSRTGDRALRVSCIGAMYLGRARTLLIMGVVAATTALLGVFASAVSLIAVAVAAGMARNHDPSASNRHHRTMGQHPLRAPQWTSHRADHAHHGARPFHRCSASPTPARVSRHVRGARSRRDHRRCSGYRHKPIPVIITDESQNALPSVTTMIMVSAYRTNAWTPSTTHSHSSVITDSKPHSHPPDPPSGTPLQITLLTKPNTPYRTSLSNSRIQRQNHYR